MPEPEAAETLMPDEAPSVARKTSAKQAASNPAKSTKHVCIMVLGMHRSGTGALSRATGLLGVRLPKNLLGADPTNPTGHWEPVRLIELHDRMLAERRQ